MYWIKLYHETIHDPAIARLPDRTWRRYIEMMLIAGECGQGGELPAVDHIAWTIRTDEESLTADISALIEAGLIVSGADGLAIVAFGDQQAPMPPAEYMRRKRQRERSAEIASPRQDGALEFNRRNKPAEASSPEQDDDFDVMLRLLETTVGLLVAPNDINAINQLVEARATKEDIEEALLWRTQNGRPPAKTISQLVPGILTSRNKRTQADAGSKAAARQQAQTEEQRQRYAAWNTDAEEEPDDSENETKEAKKTLAVMSLENLLDSLPAHRKDWLMRSVTLEDNSDKVRILVHGTKEYAFIRSTLSRSLDHAAELFGKPYELVSIT